VAAVANLNLAVANVALPSIGQTFDAGQTALDLVGGRVLARPRRLGE
jgi:DHA2 family multidrug resistance protein-like MFS transporter